ncbi:zinc ribbon domain-containing protein [Ancylothrix sp. C2]|uniref:zinc ribbon domain-containing protein n=1 Tax=Ancylothrix sp. D3o TaxID=2953691 RepID=UPI0021BB461D|nr:zinc ribbon domain-containing protein [Ancylothrix sp. D3o]MCT7948186.1 zinc ribbon domain-containing protein [Ancylothrix sp. D3o]
MPNCPKCNQPIKPGTITCPHCRTELKAFGHPGIPLYRSVAGKFLCESCTYHHDDTCTFPQRPYAETCTLYDDISQEKNRLQQRPVIKPSQQLRLWLERNSGLLSLLGLLLISVVVVLVSR